MKICIHFIKCLKRHQYIALLISTVGILYLTVPYLFRRYTFTTKHFRRLPREELLNCRQVVKGNPAEQKKALRIIQTSSLTPSDYVSLAKDCGVFVKSRYYMRHLANPEELAFPIAYTIMVYKDLEQVERLLRAIYRPHNHYCIHVDSKVDEKFRSAVSTIAACFPNIIALNRSLDVQWAKFSVLEADLLCMKALLLRSGRWKYLINLTGQEFPLKTNWELVQILKAFNGSNNMEGVLKRRNVARIPRENPGFNVTWFKGSIHVVVTRAFVEFVFTKYFAIRLLRVLKDQEKSNLGKNFFPDEQYFTTLNHNPKLGAPGAYLGEPESDSIYYPFVARLKNWPSSPYPHPCQSGKIARSICIWGVLDLPFVTNRLELFVNKFHLQFQPLAFNCLEEWYWDKVEAEWANQSPSVNLAYYRSLSFVKNHQ